MNINFFGVDQLHLMSDSATHPIELLATRLGALRLLAGSSLPRRHPCRAQPGQRLGLFVPFHCAQAQLKRRHSAYPAAPPAAHSGASN